MTTKGVILEQADRSVTRIEPHGGGANAAIKAETAAEKTFWQKSSPWVHGVLGVASFVPGLSVITGAIDAAIYTAEDEDGQPLFERARSKLGPLEPHEIYGFQPAIVLGGSFLLENLVKVKATVHLTLLRMFGEPTFPFSGIDIEEWLDEADTQ